MTSTTEEDDMAAKSVEREALRIAATFLQKLGMCRYPSAIKCRRIGVVEEKTCVECIEKFLLAKAKKKIEKERPK